MGTGLKTVLFLLLFSVLHFGYEATGWAFLKPFCGASESVFEHLKMGFWAYVLLVLIECYLLCRKRGSASSFLVSGMLVAVMVPWMIVLVWYVVPGLYGGPLPLALELTWALLATLITGFMAVSIHASLKHASFSFRTVFAVVLLTLLSVFFFTWFTYHPPWIDLFQLPE